MKTRFSILNATIAARFYSVAGISIAAVAVLALSSLHFAEVTGSAAHRLYNDGFVGVENSARLESLIEQHRRIVESAPAEVQRVNLEKSKKKLSEVDVRLTLLIKDLLGLREGSHIEDLEANISNKLPLLFDSGQSVLYYAYNFAQDKALEHASQYAVFADAIQADIAVYRAQRLSIADREIENLSQGANSLILWVSISALIAFILIGPFGLATKYRVLSRLKGVTKAMTALAQKEVTVDVPSLTERDEVGEMARAVQVFKSNAIELGERKNQLEQVNVQFNVALDNMAQGLCMFDSSRHLVVCNKRYAEMYDLVSVAVTGVSLDEIRARRLKVGNNPENYFLDNPTDRPNESAGTSSAITQNLADGRVIAVSRQFMKDGNWVAVHEDVTERTLAQSRIAFLARHDDLTGLPNRVLFRECLEETLAGLKDGECSGVMCVDLDQFKDVNDTLGHPIGDELLTMVAARLAETLSKTDIVARLGGDEFAIIQSGINGPEDCGDCAARIIKTLSEPYAVDGHHIVIGASIGISVAPKDSHDADQLIKNADMAMYIAKGEGRGRHRFFEHEMGVKLLTRRVLEQDLRSAIVKGEFVLHYQPLINIDSGKISGVEALIRWMHPVRGMVPPGEFIQLAEETGLIIAVGEWVIRQACRDAALWPETVTVAVNFSPAQIRSPKLVQTVMSALAHARLPAGRLEIEITESVLLQDDSATLTALHQLREMGVRISMDDFGTGYSSLSYLRTFPFDKLKIDQSFIRSSTKKDSVAIIRAIVSLARSFGISTVAEGVETSEQLDIVRAEGCTEGQGYLFSRPVPAKDIPKMIGQLFVTAVAA